MTEIIPLQTLGESEHGRIVDIVGPTACRHRLEELGLRLGVWVRVIKSGVPCIVGIEGQRLSFRPDPDTMVLVDVSNSDFATAKTPAL